MATIEDRRRAVAQAEQGQRSLEKRATSTACPVTEDEIMAWLEDPDDTLDLDFDEEV